MAYEIQMVDNCTSSDGNVKYKENEILFHICIVTKCLYKFPETIVGKDVRK